MRYVCSFLSPIYSLVETCLQSTLCCQPTLVVNAAEPAPIVITPHWKKITRTCLYKIIERLKAKCMNVHASNKLSQYRGLGSLAQKYSPEVQEVNANSGLELCSRPLGREVYLLFTIPILRALQRQRKDPFTRELPGPAKLPWP